MASPIAETAVNIPATTSGALSVTTMALAPTPEMPATSMIPANTSATVATGCEAACPVRR